MFNKPNRETYREQLRNWSACCHAVTLFVVLPLMQWLDLPLVESIPLIALMISTVFLAREYAVGRYTGIPWTAVVVQVPKDPRFVRPATRAFEAVFALGRRRRERRLKPGR